MMMLHIGGSGPSVEELGKEKGRRELFQQPSLIMAPHSGQSSVRQAKLGVSDWVQVPIE